jgi:hypothetical protein
MPVPDRPSTQLIEENIVAAANEPELEEQYYDEIRAQLAQPEPSASLDVPNHPVTTLREMDLGIDLAYSTDDKFKTYTLAKVCSVEEYLVGQVYIKVPVPSNERYMGVDTSRSNERTAPTWVLGDENSENSFVVIDLDSILLFGSIFTAKMKLKANTSKAIETFLKERKNLAKAKKKAKEQ